MTTNFWLDLTIAALVGIACGMGLMYAIDRVGFKAQLEHARKNGYTAGLQKGTYDGFQDGFHKAEEKYKPHTSHGKFVRADGTYTPKKKTQA